MTEGADRRLVEVTLERAEDPEEQVEAATTTEALEPAVSGDLGGRCRGLCLRSRAPASPSLVALAD